MIAFFAPTCIAQVDEGMENDKYNACSCNCFHLGIQKQWNQKLWWYDVSLKACVKDTKPSTTTSMKPTIQHPTVVSFSLGFCFLFLPGGCNGGIYNIYKLSWVPAAARFYWCMTFQKERRRERNNIVYSNSHFTSRVKYYIPSPFPKKWLASRKFPMRSLSTFNFELFISKHTSRTNPLHQHHILSNSPWLPSFSSKNPSSQWRTVLVHLWLQSINGLSQRRR